MKNKPPPDSKGFSSSLGDLLRARGQAPAVEPATSAAPPATSPAARPQPTVAPTAPDAKLELARTGKLVLRRERKGHGGKTVTVVEGLPPEALAAACKALKTALGCGAVVDGATVVVQGDQVERGAAFLTARGARQVVRGN